MVSGFRSAEDFRPVVGWELYQVTLDKYHVMFFFENGWQLLNIAYAFSYRSADGSVAYTFEIEGPRKTIEVDRILRERVVEVEVRAKDRLTLIFRNGDELTVHDAPELRSWWFQPMPDPNYPEKAQGWCLSDEEIY
jgi:hypothetical protein